ncbi:MAG: ATP-binding protein [Flavobacteriales bacterium]
MQFKDIIGQHESKMRLLHSFKEGRLAHAIMLLGPEGSGNLPLALAFAQYIHCAQRNEEDSCGVCPSCKRHASLQHPDIHFSFPFFNKPKAEGGDKTNSGNYASEWRAALLETPYMGIEHWRTSITKENKVLQLSVAEADFIVKRLSLKSHDGGYKFLILWLPEYLSVPTANKLLKTLEEPPENTIFIFVSSNSERILSTILSRVQTLVIPKLSDDTVREGLLQQGVAAQVAEGITHYVDGNWWRAQLLAHSEDPNMFFSTQFIDWMRMCYTKDVAKIVSWSDEMHKLSREDQKEFLMYALDQVRQNLILNYVGKSLARMNAQEQQFSEKFSAFINDRNAESLMELISDAFYDINGNAYSKMVLSDLSFKVHYQLRS